MFILGIETTRRKGIAHNPNLEVYRCQDFELCATFVKKVLGYKPYKVGFILWKNTIPLGGVSITLRYRPNCVDSWQYTTSQKYRRTRGMFTPNMRKWLNQHLLIPSGYHKYYLQIVPLR